MSGMRIFATCYIAIATITLGMTLDALNWAFRDRGYPIGKYERSGLVGYALSVAVLWPLLFITRKAAPRLLIRAWARKEKASARGQSWWEEG